MKFPQHPEPIAWLSINGKASRLPDAPRFLRAHSLPIMQARLVKLTNRLGLHARACAMVVQVASRFRCSVSLAWNGKRASARSILALMLLAAGMGATIRVETSGPDESEAMTAMVQLIADQFGEER
jgi:phosphocarrier protein